MEYDEGGRLIRIRRYYCGGNVQLAYEYGYGFDGGRRWRKDYLNGVWTRYPCGVACGAGELVEQTRPLSGGGWTTSALYFQGISLVRRNGEWHHFDPLGIAGVITGSNAGVLSSNLYDVFGVLRYGQGSAQTQYRLAVSCASELVAAEPSILMVAGTVTMEERDLRPPLTFQPLGTACDRYKGNPIPVNCQDCCDEKILDILKKKIPGKLCKSLNECLVKCAKEFPAPSDHSARAECVKGCLFEKWDRPSFVRWGVGIRNYLTCCYSLCDSASGWFMPPGGCEKVFK